METVKAPFPAPYASLLTKLGYRKKTVWVSKGTAGKPVVLRSYWDGGSRDLYAAFNSSGQSINIPVGGAPQFTPEPEAWVPSPGDVLVSYGAFQGKPATAHITLYE